MELKQLQGIGTGFLMASSRHGQKFSQKPIYIPLCKPKLSHLQSPQVSIRHTVRHAKGIQKTLKSLTIQMSFFMFGYNLSKIDHSLSMNSSIFFNSLWTLATVPNLSLSKYYKIQLFPPFRLPHFAI